MKFLLFTLSCCLLVMPACDNTPAEAQEATRPNVLFIAVDDLNTMIGAMQPESGAHTPNMDRLAERGMLFTNAHCNAPLCGPSRASLMTGLRPSTTGIYGMIPDDEIREGVAATDSIIFLPEYFGQHGYHTMGIGKLFHHHAPEGVFAESGGREKGFGPYSAERFVWDGHGTSDRSRYGKTSTDWGAFPAADSLMPDHRAAAWAVERIGRTYDQPFFLAVGFQRPHVPLYVPQKWFDLHPLENIKLPPYRSDDLADIPAVGHQLNDLPMMPTTEWARSSAEWPKIVQAYLACVSFVDHQVGRVLDALDASPYADNTVIVLWSDHGYRLGEKGTFAKHALWNVATQVPLMFAGPGVTVGEDDHPVELLDVFPTLTSLCGLPAYSRNEGVPLFNPDDAQALQTDKESVATTTFGKQNHTVRTARYRYIRYEDGGEELYDHRQDPEEFFNRADDPSLAEVKAELAERLPNRNAAWHPQSKYTFQPYFVAQKERGQ